MTDRFLLVLLLALALATLAIAIPSVLYNDVPLITDECGEATC